MLNLTLTYLPTEILLYLTNFLIEPPIVITDIGWNNKNNYLIKYDKQIFNNNLNQYYQIIKFQITNNQITNNQITNIYSLYTIIYNLNTSLRKFIPTYIFSDIIFKKYRYIEYKSLISLEFDYQLDLKKKEKYIEEIHIKSINSHKIKIIKELEFYIKKYNDFLYYIPNHQNNIIINNIYNYPFSMYIFDIIILFNT